MIDASDASPPDLRIVMLLVLFAIAACAESFFAGLYLSKKLKGRSLITISLVYLVFALICIGFNLFVVPLLIVIVFSNIALDLAFFVGYPRTRQLAQNMLKKALKELSRVRGLVELVNKYVSLTLIESIYILILTVVFGFFSFIGYVRVQVSWINRVPFTTYYYGFPLEWLQVQSDTTVSSSPIQFYWVQFFLDVILYLLLSFALVYVVSKLRR